MAFSKTDLLSTFLTLSGAAFSRACILRSFPSPYLRILAYHRILDVDRETYPYDPDLISCSPVEFDREMAFVAKHFDVMSFRDLEDDGWRKCKNPLIITFDDGYKDNYANAFPILQKYGLKATFFVTTGFIGTGVLPWWDEVQWLLGRECEPRKARKARKEELLRRMKDCSNDERERMLVEFRDRVGKPLLRDPDLFMSWDDVRGLCAAGMEIGSHTVSHPVLSRVEGGGRVRDELVSSKKRIEQEIDDSVMTFCYPVEGGAGITRELKGAVQEAGYRYACCYEHGVEQLPVRDAYCMRRIKAEMRGDFGRFRNKVLFPGVVRY